MRVKQTEHRMSIFRQITRPTNCSIRGGQRTANFWKLIKDSVNERKNVNKFEFVNNKNNRSWKKVTGNKKEQRDVFQNKSNFFFKTYFLKLFYILSRYFYTK